jgi:hypothetical protein
MRLFLIALAFSAITTAMTGASFGQDPQATGSGSTRQPTARFNETPARTYLIMRARQESDQRDALLRHYQAIGFNYGQPEIYGNTFFSAAPPSRNRRFMPPNFYTTPNQPFGF